MPKYNTRRTMPSVQYSNRRARSTRNGSSSSVGVPKLRTLASQMSMRRIVSRKK